MPFSLIQDENMKGVIRLWHGYGLVRLLSPPSEDIALVRALPHAVLMVAEQGKRVAETFAFGQTEHWAKATGSPKIRCILRKTIAAVAGFCTALGHDVADGIQMQEWPDPVRARPLRAAP